jgi:hypothetical protein
MHLSLRFENLKYDAGNIKFAKHTNDDREIFNSAMMIYQKLYGPSAKLKARQFGMGVTDLHIDRKDTNLNLFDYNYSLPYLALDKIKSKYGGNYQGRNRKLIHIFIEFHIFEKIC